MSTETVLKPKPKPVEHVLANPECFRPKTKLPKFVLNCLLNLGGLGDNIARVPAVRYLLNTNHHLQIYLWVPEYFLELATHWFGTHPRVQIRNLTYYKDKAPQNMPFRDTVSVMHNNLAHHMVDTAFNLLVNKLVSDKHKTYPHIDVGTTPPIEGPYAVVTTGFTSPTREMLPSTINSVVSYIKGLGILPVFLGRGNLQSDYKAFTRAEVDYTQGLNLVGKTNLLEAAQILGHSKFVVGLDNGLIHLAACTGDVPIICGFTTVDPKHREPIRHGERGFNFFPVVPTEHLSCRFCQSNMQFIGDHDFRDCIYGDFECLKQLGPSLYIEKINQVIHKNP